MLSFLFISLLTHFYVHVPCAPLHEAPSDEAPRVTEAIFAEEIKVVSTKGDWVAVEIAAEQPSAWMRKELLFEREAAYADCTCTVPMVEVNQRQASLYVTQNADEAPQLVLPFECRLEAEDPCVEGDWIKIKLPNARELYAQKKEITGELQPKSKEQLVPFCERFLAIPFKETGTTSFAFDSSGLVQMLYRQMGIWLPRSVQAQCDCTELEPAPLGTLEPGDLVFWGSHDRMEHVALLLDNHQVIHVSNTNGVEIVPLHAASHLSVRIGRRLK